MNKAATPIPPIEGDALVREIADHSRQIERWDDEIKQNQRNIENRQGLIDAAKFKKAAMETAYKAGQSYAPQ